MKRGTHSIQPDHKRIGLFIRDRETRLSEIADAAPVPEWIQMVGKFCGLAMLIVAYQVMQIIGCMLIQASPRVDSLSTTRRS